MRCVNRNACNIFDNLSCRKSLCSRDHKDTVDHVKCKVERLQAALGAAAQDVKQGVQENIDQLNENFNGTMENLIEMTKEKYLSKDMKDAIETIQLVLGRIIKN